MTRTTDTNPIPVTELPALCVQRAPFLRAPEQARTIHLVTLCAAGGPLLAGCVLFGWRAIIVAGLAISASVFFEHVYYRVTRTPALMGRSHACLMGVLLAMTLPAHAPWYIPIVAAAFSIIVAKAIFGGVGHFLWHPALVGRVAAAVLFAAVITPDDQTAAQRRDLPAPGYGFILTPDNIVDGDLLLPIRIENYQAWNDDRNVQMLTGAQAFEVPLPTEQLTALSDAGGPHYSGLATVADVPQAEPAALLTLPPLDDLIFGTHPGGIGETCAAAIVVCGLYLLYRNYVKWQLPISFVVSAAVVFAIGPVYLADQNDPLGAWRWLPITLEGLDTGFTYVNCQLLAGELLLAAFFIAPEMTSRPVTTGGQVLFGIGCGLIGAILHQYVHMPVPFYSAVLIMNTFTPRIDRLWHRRPAHTSLGATTATTL